MSNHWNNEPEHQAPGESRSTSQLLGEIWITMLTLKTQVSAAFLHLYIKVQRTRSTHAQAQKKPSSPSSTKNRATEKRTKGRRAAVDTNFHPKTHHSRNNLSSSISVLEFHYFICVAGARCDGILYQQRIKLTGLPFVSLFLFLPTSLIFLKLSEFAFVFWVGKHNEQQQKPRARDLFLGY